MVALQARLYMYVCVSSEGCNGYEWLYTVEVGGGGGLEAYIHIGRAIDYFSSMCARASPLAIYSPSQSRTRAASSRHTRQRRYGIERDIDVTSRPSSAVCTLLPLYIYIRSDVFLCAMAFATLAVWWTITRLIVLRGNVTLDALEVAVGAILGFYFQRDYIILYS